MIIIVVMIILWERIIKRSEIHALIFWYIIVIIGVFRVRSHAAKMSFLWRTITVFNMRLGLAEPISTLRFGRLEQIVCRANSVKSAYQTWHTEKWYKLHRMIQKLSVDWIFVRIANICYHTIDDELCAILAQQAAELS